MSKLPSFKQWLKLPSVLNKREALTLTAFSIIFLISLVAIILNFYYGNTKIAPAFGGKHIIGVVGAPSSINPIYAANSDVDRQLTELIFSGILKNEGGQLVPDLAESLPEIKDNGTTYDILLKDNTYFHDGKKLTADDVIFTIKSVQEVDYKSPLRANWLGVKAEKISDYAVRIKLKNPYPDFLERLTIKILPAHIWENISPTQFQFSPYNFKPIGSGPYQLRRPTSDIIQNKNSGDITAIKLEAFSKYYAGKPNIKEIEFNFFKNDKDLLWAAQTGKINGFIVRSAKIFASSRFSEYSFPLPRYFALFFNQKKNPALEKISLRQALAYATNKQQIIEKIFAGRAQAINSPIVPEFYGYNLPSSTYDFNLEKATELMQKSGYEKQDGKWVKSKTENLQFKTTLKQGSLGDEVKKLQTCLAGIEDESGKLYPEDKINGIYDAATKKSVERFQLKYRSSILDPEKLKTPNGQVRQRTMDKLNEVCAQPAGNGESLALSITISEDEVLKKTAEEIKSQWESFGIQVEIKEYPLLTLKQDIIGQRNYEILLFGEILSLLPDPFPFWHSSQMMDPGLNLAEYKNGDVDKLLESARQETDASVRQKKYEQMQEIILKDVPAVFLYNPDNVYISAKEVKGIIQGNISDISQIFSATNKWYIKTKRIWK